MKRAVLAAVLLACAAPTLAADPVVDQVAADANWQHQWTGLVAPPQIAGFTRDSVKELHPNQLDMMITYFDRPTLSLASIFVFRPGLADVSIWQERATQSLIAEPEFGSTGFNDVVAGNFTPRAGGGKDSGLIAYGRLTGGKGTAAGIAMFAHDGWLVEVRMSSAQLDRDALSARLVPFLSSLELSPAQVEYPPAADIAPCDQPLGLAKNVRHVKADMTQLLLISAIAPQMRIQTGDDDKPVTPIAPRNFCRDANSTSAYGVYRAGGDQQSYVVAFGDAGQTVIAGRNDVASLLGGAKDYWVVFADVAKISVYTPFAKLPSPEQAIAAVQQEAPITAVEDAPGGQTNITLPGDAFKK